MRASPYSDWSNPKSPGSRAKSVRTCQCLRPRRVIRALAITPPNVLPSALSTASAPRSKVFSRLIGWPMRSPTDASPTPSRAPAHGSEPMWFAIPSSQWTCTTYSLPVSRRTDNYLDARRRRAMLRTGSRASVLWKVHLGKMNIAAFGNIQNVYDLQPTTVRLYK